MIPSLPRPVWLRASTVVYGVLFFAFLFLPLAVQFSVVLFNCFSGQLALRANLQML